ncbi:MAG: DNA replication/repair protein RecF [bacterium]|nr:DNA replication/repair protein RecF [bacterium]
MKIQRLLLRNFRNIRRCDLVPGDSLNILAGDNGQGKTNLLEAIYFLAHLSTFRATPQKGIMLEGETAARMEASIVTEGGSKEIAVYLDHKTKQAKVNGKAIQRGVDFYGEMAVILFAPESLKLVKEGPEFRRRFIDRAISRTDRKYLMELKEYGKILKQRNRMLQMIRSGRVPRNALNVWSEQQARTGSRILLARYRYLEALVPVCRDIFQSLAHKTWNLGVQYRSSLARPPALGRGNETPSLDALTGRFRDSLARVEKQEIEGGASGIGPHRDDITFLVDGRPFKGFSSQGESRMLALTLILSEARLYQSSSAMTPILLLDDVGSELDHRHRAFLQTYLKTQGQVFLTTTDGRRSLAIGGEAVLFHVKKGEITVEKKGEKM